MVLRLLGFVTCMDVYIQLSSQRVSALCLGTIGFRIVNIFFVLIKVGVVIPFFCIQIYNNSTRSLQTPNDGAWKRPGGSVRAICVIHKYCVYCKLNEEGLHIDYFHQMIFMKTMVHGRVQQAHDRKISHVPRCVSAGMLPAIWSVAKTNAEIL